MAAALCDCDYVSDRLLQARSRLASGMHLSVLLCYAPTDTPSSVAASEQFYVQLSAQMAALPQRDVVVAMGDFNARVGTDAAASWGSSQRALQLPAAVGDAQPKWPAAAQLRSSAWPGRGQHML
jgi:endonuclease/exonuclease/phosphatase family metal-dependent hydrolase